MEGVFALRLLTRPSSGDTYPRWRVALRNSLRSNARAVLAMQPDRTTEPLLRLLEWAAHDETAPAARGAGQDAARLALTAWRAGVCPYWESMLGRLEAVCAAHAGVAATGGVEQLLSTLHPRIRWHAPVLEIDGGPDRDIWLDGRGLVIKPSVFLPGEAGRVVACERDSGHTVLVFAAEPDLVDGWDEITASAEDTGEDGESRALSALVGQTRAAALRVLTDTSTNSQLAARLGVSPGVASRHAAVLRETGLISTRRVGSSALHTVTPLGKALLDGQLRSVLPFTVCRDTRGGVPAPQRIRSA